MAVRHAVGVALRVAVAAGLAPRRTRLGRPRGSTGSQIERNKHRLASLVLLGRRNGQIARELGVSSRTIRTWLNHPDVQEAIRELEEELHRSTERLLAGLYRGSIRRMHEIIRKGEGKLALRAIELLWSSSGLLQKAGPETNVFNQQRQLVNVQPTFDRADAKAAMALLRRERERHERERESELAPSQIERSVGERSGP